MTAQIIPLHPTEAAFVLRQHPANNSYEPQHAPMIEDAQPEDYPDDWVENISTGKLWAALIGLAAAIVLAVCLLPVSV